MAKFMDRLELIDALKDNLQLTAGRTAVVAIDMHRGHLDPEHATLPVEPDKAKRVIAATKRLLTLAREHNIPIIHVVVEHRMIPGLGREGLANPFSSAVANAKLNLSVSGQGDLTKHNIVGSVQVEIIPELGPQAEDFVIRSKRRLSIFYGTDLELLLRALKVDTLLLAGINTNTCVQCACFESYNRDLRPVVISDCVDSMYGDDLHEFALQNVCRCIGWVLNLEELQAKLA